MSIPNSIPLPQQLQDTHVKLHIDIFDEKHDVFVRKTLLIARFKEFILQEFKDLDSNRQYELVGENGQSLPEDVDLETVIKFMPTISQQVLKFQYQKAVVAPTPVASSSAMIEAIRPEQLNSRATGSYQAVPSPNPQTHIELMDVNSGVRFELRNFPASIGRKSGSETHLEVDLANLPGGQTVSRHHATIFKEEKGWFIESLAQNNPVKINTRTVQLGERGQLHSGDRVTFGKVIMAFLIK